MVETVSGHQIKLDGYTCLQPDEVIAHLASQGRPTSHIEGFANKFILPAGREYGRGSVIMTAWAVRNILKDFALGLNASVEAEHRDPYRFDHVLSLKDGVSTFNINQLGIVRVISLAGFNEHHYNNPPPERSIQPVRVDLADARYIARYSAIDLAFNVRSRDSLTWGSANSYYKPSLNAGSPWGWGQIITTLYGYLPAAITRNALIDSGVYPTSDPQNLVFRGMSAWDALNTILHNTGNVIYRTSTGGVWTIESQSVTQGNTADRLSHKAFINDPTWDYPMNVTKSVHIPKTIRVYFPTNYTHFPDPADDGSSMDRIVTGKDAWLQQPLKEKDVLTSDVLTDPDAVLGYFMDDTVLALHSGLMANYDETGTLLNDAALTTRSEEMAAEWLAARDWETKNSLHTIYNYYHELFQPGTEVSAVAWYNEGQGSRTEVLLSPLKFSPDDELGFIGKNSVQETLAWEIHSPPDVSRHHGPDDGFLVGQVYADSSNGNAFQVTVLKGTHSGSATMTWADSGKSVYVFPLVKAKYCAGDKILAWWHQQTKRWVTHRDYPLFAFGNFDSRMCVNDYTVTDSQWTNAFSCEVHNESITLNNYYHLAAKSGDKWFAYRGCGSCSEWIVLQVEHHAEDVVLANEFSQTSGCTDNYLYPGVTTPNQDCRIIYGYRQNSVMYCDETVNRGNLAYFYAILVMTNWYIVGNTIYGLYRWIYVPCACTEFSAVITVGVNCSGSGGGGTTTTPTYALETFVSMNPRTPNRGPGGPWQLP